MSSTARLALTGFLAVLASSGEARYTFDPNAGQADARIAFVARGDGATVLLKTDGEAAWLDVAAPGGARDVFVTKLGPLGQVVYSTYLGGSHSEFVQDIAVDATGAVYLTGLTQSDDWPQVGGRPEPVDGLDDAFVTKIDPSGAALVYSRLLGGAGAETGEGIVVDADGKAWLTGETTSRDFPLVVPAQASFGGGTDDMFVTRLGPDGTDIEFSTYHGGAEHDHGNAIAITPSGAIAIVGHTSSSDLPTVRPVQATRGGAIDAMVVVYDASGALVFSTHLGGGDDDWGVEMAIDGSGAVYVAGSTDSTDLPLAPAAGPLQPAHGGVSDAFIAKLDIVTPLLVYSTYHGGSGEDWGTAVAVDGAGRAVLVGMSASADFPLADPLTTTWTGTDDAFVAKLDENGTALVDSTYLGGDGSDDAQSVALDSDGHAWVAGETWSSDLPLMRAAQARLGGDGDAFVAEIVECASAALPGAVGNTLKSVRLGPDMHMTWSDIAAATSYIVFETLAGAGPYTVVTGAAASGSTGLMEPLPAEPLLFYRVAGENDCGLGPL